MISSWMKGLVIYLILSGLIMKLIPGKSYERYISIYMGLILVLILIKPVMAVFGAGEGDVERLMDSVSNYLSFNQTEYDNNHIKSNYYELGLAESIKADCDASGYEIYDVSAISDSDNNIIKIIIYVGSDMDENSLKNFINNVYKVDFESIYIVRR